MLDVIVEVNIQLIIHHHEKGKSKVVFRMIQCGGTCKLIF